MISIRSAIPRYLLALTLVILLCPVSATYASVDNSHMELPATTTQAKADGKHPATLSLSAKQVVVIDSAVADPQRLLNGIDPAFDVIRLKAGRDGLAQLAEALQGRSGIETLHLISHGGPANLLLGGSIIDSTSLDTHAKTLAAIGRAFAKDGDILLYACDVAKGENGEHFVRRFGAMTEADIAASDDATGAAVLGGDWMLERTYGTIDSTIALPSALRDNYRHLLATYDFEGATGHLTYTVTTTVSGVTLTVTDPWSTFWLGDGSGFAGTSGTLLVGGVLTTDLTTFTFSSPVNLSTFRFGCQGVVINYTFTPIGGTGNSPVNVTSSTAGADMNVNWNGITGFTVTENGDDGIFSDTLFDTFVFTPAITNTAPVIGGAAASQAVNDSATISPFSAVTITDADGDNVTTTLTLDTNAKGVFTSTSLTASGFTGTGPYTLASTTPANAQTAIRQLVFDPTNNRVAPGSTETTTFTITVNDGTVDSTDSTTTVISTSINDAPVITSNGGGANASTFINENSTAVTTVTATDPDSGETQSFSISGGADAAQFSINSSSGALTFSITPDFEAPADSGGNNIYDVQVAVTDGYAGTDVQDLAVTVGNINENPIITSDGGGATASVNAAENQTAVTTVTAADQDSGDTLTFSISGGADQALFGINGSTGALTFNSAPNYESPGDSGGNNVYDVQVTVTDDGADTLTDVQAIAVTVTNSNEAPVITSNGGGATGTTSINENTTAVTTVTATDADSSDTLTFSISGGADAAFFSINSGTGALVFAAAPDYETPADSGGNNVYDVQVTVTDNGVGNLTDVQAIAVTVTNANENPVITSNGGGATASINAAENQTAVTTVTATDSDTGDTLTYSISGGADQALFGINGSTGALTFNSAPNYESPTDSGANNVYDVQVTVTDNGAGTLTDVQAIAITVTNANEAPVITSNGGGATASTSINESTTAVTTVTATDADSSDTLTFSISGGADAAFFSINSGTGALVFAAAPDYETPADSGGNNVYDMQVTVTDNGTGNLTDVQSIAITINNVNENPVITSNGGGATASVNAAENQTAVTTVTATDSDTGDTLTYAISGGADQALFGINSSTGALTFNSAPNYESPTDSGANNVYDVQVTVADNGAGTLTDVQAIAVTVTNSNEAPVITSNGGGATATTSVNENTTAVTTVTATDGDSGDTLTYSISGGADAARFSVNSSTGAVVFSSAPDYETPADSGGNNVYDVQVTVTDNGTGNLTDVQAITITVNNVNENPVITSNGGGATASVNVAENQTAVTSVTASDDDAGDTLTYTISGGADQALFSINGSTGVLTFISAPDYESPTDSGGNNVYDLQVTVTDDGSGTLTDVQAIAITVTGANESPVITSNGSGATATISINENTTAVTTITATDVDSGDTLTYSLTGGADTALFNINGSSGALAFTTAPDYETPTDSGNNNIYDLQVTVTDNGSGNLTDVQAIAVTINDLNEAPSISGAPGTTPENDVLFSFAPTSSDPDTGATLSFSINTTPSWATFNTATGELSGTPAQGDVGTTTSNIIISVSDGSLSDSLAAFSLTVAQGNQAPTISGSPATSVAGHTAYSFVPTANDADSDPLTFSIMNKPAWASFDPATGELSGSPTNSDVGTTTGIEISVSDGTSSASLTFDLSVTENLDIDGDGMPNDWELANGLDPNDPTDAAGDLDGDGLTNLQEYLGSNNPNADDNPPVVTPPADITIDAIGLFTPVEVGSGSAYDALDGILTPSSDALDYYTPGIHTITWSASDAAGNTGSATQTVNVIPLVSFSKDQVGTEGGTVAFRVILNGPAVSYPVSLPYVVAGTAAVDGSDHDLSDGIAVIPSGLETTVTFTTLDDGPGEGTEQIVIAMETPTNAVAGAHAMHTIDLMEGNVPPRISLSADQGAGQVRSVVVGGGPVVVSSDITDPNTGDSHTYDWTATDAALADTDSLANTYTFSPTGLSPGLYTLRLNVSDGSATDSNSLSLHLIAAAPTLSASLDSDGDGADDASEGMGDGDNDGVADYLDAIESANVLQEQSAVSNGYLIESEPSVRLGLGAIALQLDNGAASVAIADIESYGGVRTDAQFDFQCGLFDFTVDEIPQAGQSVAVVLAQLAPIPDNAVYRKAQSGAWQDFVTDARNSVASATGEPGYCPPPGDSAYSDGLTAGHWCVQLTIEDGGPNDADGSANNTIEDPGGVAERLSSTVSVTSRGGGGGSSGWGLLLSLMSLWLWRASRQRREVA